MRKIASPGALGALTVLLIATSCDAQNADRATTAHYSWNNVEINGGGFISGIIFHPSKPNLIYARTDIGGAYRWNAATKRWRPITDVFGPSEWNLLGIESIALDKHDANRVYLAVGTYTSEWATNGALLRSTDCGETWQRSELPFKNGGNESGRSMGERLIVDPQQPNVLYLGTRRNGLWKSLDYGASWGRLASWPVPDNASGYGVSWLAYGKDDVLYAGVADNGVNLYRSSDDGRSWQAVGGGPRGFFPHHGVFDAQGTLFVTYGDGPGPNGMSNGAVWKLVPATGAWTDITPLRPNRDGEGGFGYAGLSVDGKVAGTLMVATMDRWAKGDDIFRSTDGGATWKGLKTSSERDASAAPYLKWGKTNADLGHWIGALQIDPFRSGHVLYGTGATLWGSDDADGLDRGQPTYWTVRSGGIEETAVDALISLPQGPHLLSGLADIGGFRHGDLTISPAEGMMSGPLSSRNQSLDFAGRKPSVVVRIGNGSGGFSHDASTSWTPFTVKPPNPDPKGSLGRVAVSADGAIWVCSLPQGPPQVTRDGSASWKAAEGLPQGATVIADREDASVFYGLDGPGKTLYLSRDGARNFATLTILPGRFDNLTAAPGQTGHLWMAGSDGLVRTTNAGATFTRLAMVSSATGIGYGKAAPGHAYPALYLSGKIGEWNGLFRSDDEGATWVQLNDLNHQWGWVGKAITGDPRVYGRVYVSTNGRGVQWGEPDP